MLADILRLAQKVVPTDDIDLEIEDEDKLISQYTVEAFDSSDQAVTLQLANKHTDCLAKELCGLPTVSGDCCDGPSDCC